MQRYRMLLQDGKKMSTRYGKSVTLNGVLNESIDLAKEYISKKNDNLEIYNNMGRKL